jgi:hypothetical protein
MSKVDDAALVLYGHFEANLNKGWKLNNVLSATGLRNNATTKTALRRIREWAVRDGLILRLPCPANGNTYADGVKRTEEKHRSFIREHRAALTRGDREIVAIIDEFEESQRGQQKLIHRLIGVTVEARRKARRPEDDDV